MMQVTRKQKGHKKKKKRRSGCKSPASSVAHLISALFFWYSMWCSQQPQSNLMVTLSPSLQAFKDAISLQEVALTLIKKLGSSSRSARSRGQSQQNYCVRSLTRQIQT
ncbi:hypothetical protein E2C01_082915 [Portunus trituberculatus]|uniref:Uncharacterized protein n=1 Tax=Portunus trituberculatus TaxID=210409 RepID=A0A5B7J232_PORTR|nr:hypothetical protein [Portunus trituberculatus]